MTDGSAERTLLDEGRGRRSRRLLCRSETGRSASDRSGEVAPDVPSVEVVVGRWRHALDLGGPGLGVVEWPVTERSSGTTSHQPRVFPEMPKTVANPRSGNASRRRRAGQCHRVIATWTGGGESSGGRESCRCEDRRRCGHAGRGTGCTGPRTRPCRSRRTCPVGSGCPLGASVSAACIRPRGGCWRTPPGDPLGDRGIEHTMRQADMAVDRSVEVGLGGDRSEVNHGIGPVHQAGHHVRITGEVGDHHGAARRHEVDAAHVVADGDQVRPSDTVRYAPPPQVITTRTWSCWHGRSHPDRRPTSHPTRDAGHPADGLP